MTHPNTPYPPVLQQYPGYDQQSQRPNPPIISFNNSPSSTNKYSLEKLAKCLGYTQVGIGIFCVVVMVVKIIASDFISSEALFGYGIWGGILFIITGSFGILLEKRSNGNGMVVTFLVLCIISTLVAFYLIYMAITTAKAASFISNIFKGFDNIRENGLEENYYNSSREVKLKSRSLFHDLILKEDVVMVMSVTLALLSFGEVAVAIISSALCCQHVCHQSSMVYIPQNDVPIESMTVTSDVHLRNSDDPQMKA